MTFFCPCRTVRSLVFVKLEGGKSPKDGFCLALSWKAIAGFDFRALPGRRLIMVVMMHINQNNQIMNTNISVDRAQASQTLDAHPHHSLLAFSHLH